MLTIPTPEQQALLLLRQEATAVADGGNNNNPPQTQGSRQAGRVSETEEKRGKIWWGKEKQESQAALAVNEPRRSGRTLPLPTTQSAHHKEREGERT